MLKLGRAWSAPEELAPLVSGWDKLSNLFKTWVTAPFPAFHMRNLVSGFFNQWRDDAFSLGANKQAIDILRGGLLAKAVLAVLVLVILAGCYLRLLAGLVRRSA